MWRLMVAIKSVQIIRPKEPLEIRDLQARRPEGDEVLLRVESWGIYAIAIFISWKEDMQDLKASLWMHKKGE